MNNHNKLNSLQALRGIAFIGIFLLHAGSSINWSNLSVSIFFVLSGFLMVYTYIDKNIENSFKSYIKFAFTKIKKLYPLHIITMLLAFTREFFLLLYTGGGINLLAKLFGNLTLNTLLIQSWFFPTQISCSLNGVAWYLSATLFLYFMFPLILHLIKHIHNRRKLLVVGLLILITQYILSLLTINIDGSNSSLFTWTTYISPIYRSGDFIIGCITGYLYITSERKTLSPPKATLFEILVVLLSTLAIFWTKKEHSYATLINAVSENRTLLYIPIAVILVIMFTCNYGAITKLLTNKFFIYIGNISPYTFLIHLVVIGYAALFLGKLFSIINLPTPLNRICLITAEFFITIIATQLYLLLNKKIIKLKLNRTKH